MKKSLNLILLVAMMLIFALLHLSLLRQKGLFIDDAVHMPAGYSYLTTGDYRLNQEHPPFIKLLSALGLTVVHPRLQLDSSGWQQAAQPQDPEDGMQKIEEGFFDINADRYERITFWGRLPMLTIPLLLVIAVYWLTKSIINPLTGLLAAFLLLTEPNIIGNSTVVQNDVAACLALVLIVIAMRAYFRNATAVNASLLGGALGFALITKYSLVPFVALSSLIMIAILTIKALRRQPALLSNLAFTGIALLTAYLILIAAYAFHINRIDADEAAMICQWFYLPARMAGGVSKMLTSLPPLLPKYFVYGVDMVVQDSRVGRPAFLFGQVSAKGWWYYFPVAFALKTTLPFLLITIAGTVWAGFQIIRRKRLELLYLVLPAILYLGLSMTSHLNIGVRHVLPMFPFLAMAGATMLTKTLAIGRLRRWRIPEASIAIVCIWSAILAVLTYPNYQSYFSPLAGGATHGWQKLSDSNVEAGQEVKPLAQYLKEHGETTVSSMVIGGEFLRFYGVTNYELPGWVDEPPEDESDADTNDQDNQDEDSTDKDSADKDDEDSNDQQKDQPEVKKPEHPLPEYVAIGAWYMTETGLSPAQKKAIDVYRNQQPEAFVGNSIFVFRLRQPEKSP
jgi:Dolichyl-phosphate-mannose-protein mannosyltransferase